MRLFADKAPTDLLRYADGVIVSIVASIAIQTSPIQLSRGSDIGQPIRYWDVTDTFVDSGFPDSNFGRETILTCGPKRTILIRFGDLRRAVSNQHSVLEAKLVLTPSFGTRAKFRSIAKVLVPWGAGPGGRGISAKDSVAAWCATWKQRRCGPGGLGWDKAGARGPDDAIEIASAQAEYVDGKLVISGIGTAVQEMLSQPNFNFGFALQFDEDGDFASSDAERGKPELRITTAERPIVDGSDLCVEYISSSWRGPAMTPPKGARISYSAKVTNVGKGDSGPYSLQWAVREQKRSGAAAGRSLATGESQVFHFELSAPESKGDHRINPLSASVVQAQRDRNPANDCVEIDQLAIPVKGSVPTKGHSEAQQVLSFVNDTVLAQSLFSFAPDGCRERFRYDPEGALLTWKTSPEMSLYEDATSILVSAGVPVLSTSRFPLAPETPVLFGKSFWRRCANPFEGQWGGDTRDDTQFPNLLYMEVDPWPDKLLGLLKMPTTDLLGALHVQSLHLAMDKFGTARPNVLSAWPRTCLVRVLYPNGEPIGGLELNFYRIRNGLTQMVGPEPEAKLTSTAQGIVVLSNVEGNTMRILNPDGSDAIWLVSASRHGVTEFAWMRAYQWVDAFARSGKSAAILPLRFDLPVEPIDESINLAQGRIVVDSDNVLPEVGSTLVDGNAATAIDLPGKEGQWIEVDIGRDRTLGQVQLELVGDSAWGRFEIKLYGTGQRPSEVGIWAEEVNGTFAAMNRSDRSGGGNRILTYRGFPARARYVRIVNRSTGNGMKLAELRLSPLKG